MNGGGGSASMRERSERVGNPGTYVTECFTQPFLIGPVFFRTALPCSGGYHLERGRMRLVLTVKMAQILKIKAQMSSIWATVCMLIVCVV